VIAGNKARPERVPLSFAQRRLWFLAQLEGPGLYNVPLVLRLEGELDRQALESALGDVVGRHESLRTVFPAVDGEPFQRVLPAGDAPVSVTWQTVSAAEAARLISLACGYEFSLADEIPVHAEVVSTGPREHVLVLVMHHIACDGLSLSPLARDLAAAYGARLAGSAPGWADLPVQYADYALWQHAMLGREDDPGSVMAHQVAFWRRTLEAAPEEIALPADRPRPAAATHRGAITEFRIDADVHAQLAALARQAGASMFMVVQAALASLLTLLGAGTDIPLGVPAAGRADDALSDLVGFFVNTLVLRVDTSGTPGFRELLARVRDTDLAAYQNQDLPFDLLVQTLNPARSAARYPLFQVMLSFENGTEAQFEMPGLRVVPERLLDLEKLPGFAVTARHDLTFTVRERFSADGSRAGIEGTLGYATDLFDRDTAQHLTHALTRILHTAATTPDAPITHTELLTSDD
jgi:Condensation domain